MRSEMPSAAVVRAKNCENCNRAESHVRRRHVVEAGTEAEADRFLCAHCTGGMLDIGHVVTPFSMDDAAEYVHWLQAPRVRSVVNAARWSEPA